MDGWRFLTSHGLVFVYKSLNPESTVREIARDLNLTERAVHRVLRSLEAEGYLIKERIGRGSFHRVNGELTLRHPFVSAVPVKDILAALMPLETHAALPRHG